MNRFLNFTGLMIFNYLLMTLPQKYILIFSAYRVWHVLLPGCIVCIQTDIMVTILTHFYMVSYTYWSPTPITGISGYTSIIYMQYTCRYHKCHNRNDLHQYSIINMPIYQYIIGLLYNCHNIIKKSCTI